MSADEAGHRPLCLFGAGGHGRVVARQARDLLGLECRFADAGRRIGDRVDDVPVVATDPAALGDWRVVVTIGDNAARARVQARAEATGARPASLVMEPARFFGADPEPGVQVLAGAVVNPGARLGAGAIVNTSAVVEHDARVGPFAHVAPGAVMGGGSSVGRGVLLGTHATVLPGVRVTDGAVIGAGAVVAADIDEPGVYIGVPARRARA